jgi:hypothetical protein
MVYSKKWKMEKYSTSKIDVDELALNIFICIYNPIRIRPFYHEN